MISVHFGAFYFSLLFYLSGCDLRLDNYRCDEIKDGTVIIKQNGKNATSDENVNEDLLDAEEL